MPENVYAVVGPSFTTTKPCGICHKLNTTDHCTERLLGTQGGDKFSYTSKTVQIKIHLYHKGMLHVSRGSSGGNVIF
jgi:hypothetical protein